MNIFRMSICYYGKENESRISQLEEVIYKF